MKFRSKERAETSTLTFRLGGGGGGAAATPADGVPSRSANTASAAPLHQLRTPTSDTCVCFGCLRQITETHSHGGTYENLKYHFPVISCPYAWK